MKKKLLVVLICLLAGGGCIYGIPYLVEIEVNRRLDLVEVVYAAKRIEPRTVIDESHVATMMIPSAYVNEKAYISINDVLGMIVSSKGSIFEGSLFYYDSVESKDSISDGVIYDLKKDQVVFAVETNLVQLAANALIPNQIIDVYVTFEDQNRERVFSELLSHVRILGVKDHLGLNLDDPESTGSPHVLQLAISKEALPVLQKAIDVGKISYYASNDAYESDEECSIVWDSAAVSFLGFGKEKSPQ